MPPVFTMPIYQVVTPWSPSVKVNDKIETDNLHPFLRQHVVELKEGGAEERKQVVEPPKTKTEKKHEGPDLAKIQEARDQLPAEMPVALVNKLHAEAIKEDAKRFPPTKEV